ncbi:MAG TPA: hypothetical protein VGC21_22875 [Telluria sp.]|jgi:hypothetical protein
MAYHFAGEGMWEVASAKPITPLDSCAYTVLVSLYSVVEDALEQKQIARSKRSLQKKQQQLIASLKLLREGKADWEAQAAALEEAQSFKAASQQRSVGSSSSSSSPPQASAAARAAQKKQPLSRKEELRKEFLQIILGPNGNWPGLFNRIDKNGKLASIYGAILAGDAERVDVDACARLAAALDLADEPGLRCVAVAMDASRRLYVAGNGLWRLGPDSPEGTDVLETPDWNAMKDGHAGTIGALGNGLPDAPTWFSTKASADLALRLIAPDIIGEYALRSIVFVSPSAGDFDGKFHAEMQLLEYFVANDVYPQAAYVGVSKPCCAHCASSLERAGLQFWTRHAARGPDFFNAEQSDYPHFKDAAKLAAYKAKIEEIRRTGPLGKS